MKKQSCAAILMIILASAAVRAQQGCQVPLSPVLRSVSVNPDNGFTRITWQPSPSAGIAGYVIYTYKDGTGMAVDTVWDPTATSYVYTSNVSRYYSVSYVVAAHRVPDCTSPLSNAVSSVFCSTEIDTCKKELKIKWNSYTDYPVKVSSYTIAWNANGGKENEITGIQKTLTSYTINDFSTGLQYCFTVKVVLEDGSMSVSNRSCLTTKMQRAPAWINADNSIVSADGKILLSFTVDPLTEIKTFSLERKTGSSGVFTQLAQPSLSSGKIFYTDNQSDVSRVNYYRLSAINNCNIPVTVSNLSSNVALASVLADGNIKLNWNAYRQWKGITGEQNLFIDRGNGFSKYSDLAPGDTSTAIDYRAIMYTLTKGKVCFYIDIRELQNPHGIEGHSVSSVTCTDQPETVTVPNVFSPNGDSVNDRFSPVLSFTPSAYEFRITNTNGKVLFITGSFGEEWDGTSGGEPVPQGVFLWNLKLVTPSGRTVVKNGTVTVVRDRQ